MPYDVIGKFMLLGLCSLATIFTLLTISKKKKHFQIFPDQIKKDFYKMVRMMSILSIVSAFLIIGACFIFSSNLMYILLVISLFLSASSLYALYDEFNELDI